LPGSKSIIERRENTRYLPSTNSEQTNKEIKMDVRTPSEVVVEVEELEIEEIEEIVAPGSVLAT
jgi:hypothetical protein